MADTFPKILDVSVLSDDAQKLLDTLNRRIIGQERAVRTFVRAFQQVEAGLNKPCHPAAVFLFMGPTGVGKTELVRVTAEVLLGKKEAITRIDCGEFQEAHEIAKLIGSPPGYLGYGEDNARLTQDKIDKYQTQKHKINFVLFDEIEEAHDHLL
jgi:ATP-dependent Clp protease ATP-binding subunit ClpB